MKLIKLIIVKNTRESIAVTYFVSTNSVPRRKGKEELLSKVQTPSPSPLRLGLLSFSPGERAHVPSCPTRALTHVAAQWPLWAGLGAHTVAWQCHGTKLPSDLWEPAASPSLPWLRLAFCNRNFAPSECCQLNDNYINQEKVQDVGKNANKTLPILLLPLLPLCFVVTVQRSGSPSELVN